MVFSKERYTERRARKNAAKAEVEAVVEEAPAVVFIPCNRCGKKVAVSESDAADGVRCADCVA